MKHLTITDCTDLLHESPIQIFIQNKLHKYESVAKNKCSLIRVMLSNS